MAISTVGGVFISYRREDAAPYARLLHYQLRERLPDVSVFMDLDSIEAGLDFAEEIEHALDSSAVLIALIGRQWATLADDDGRRRLDDPDDFVRHEIRAALERCVRVIPVLVDGAKHVRREQLPAELHKLARLHPLDLSYGRYEYDSDRLLALVERVLTNSGRADKAKLFAAASRVNPANAVARPDKRLVIDAEHIAAATADMRIKALVLASLSKALAATDPDRADQLSADSEHIAESIAEKERAKTLTEVAKVLAVTDADRAEHIGRSLSDRYSAANVLADVAGSLATTNPDRACKLFADAERLARSMNGDIFEPHTLACIARAMASAYPERAAGLLGDAERIARCRTADWITESALADVATALATVDPDWAERIVRSIPADLKAAGALAYIGQAVTLTDPDRASKLFTEAEQIAISVTQSTALFFDDHALAEVAVAMATADPDRAEHIAASIIPESQKGRALAAIALALAATDSHRAERIARSIIDDGWRARALLVIASAV